MTYFLEVATENIVFITELRGEHVMSHRTGFLLTCSRYYLFFNKNLVQLTHYKVFNEEKYYYKHSVETQNRL